MTDRWRLFSDQKTSLASGLCWHFLEGRWACGLIQHAFQVLVVPTGLSILCWADGASSYDVLKVCRGWAKGIGSFGSPGSFFLMAHLLHHELVLLSARWALMFLAQDPSSFLDMHLSVPMLLGWFASWTALAGFHVLPVLMVEPPLSLLCSGTIRITSSVWLVILIQSWSSVMVSGSWENILPATFISSVVVFFHCLSIFYRIGGSLLFHFCLIPNLSSLCMCPIFSNILSAGPFRASSCMRSVSVSHSSFIQNLGIRFLVLIFSCVGGCGWVGSVLKGA